MPSQPVATEPLSGASLALDDAPISYPGPGPAPGAGIPVNLWS